MSNVDESDEKVSGCFSNVLFRCFRRKTSPDEGNEASDTQSEPGLIADVIPHLCKFLGISDIKQCRLVCQMWNYAVTPVLKERTMVVVPLYAEYDDPRKDGGIVERLKFCSANVHLKTSFPFTNNRQLINPKILVSVENLKSAFVEYLTPPQEWQKELCEIMILGSVTTLEKLKFGGVFAGDFPAFDCKLFRKLKKLDINYGQLPEKHCRNRISRAVTETFPNLEHLKIDGRLYFLASLENSGMKLPRSLNSLVVSGDLDTRVLEYLLTSIDPPLKKLKLGQSFHVGSRSDPRLDEIPTILYKLLSKHSSTLEVLYIRILNRDPGGEEMNWQLPVFPKLKKFESLKWLYAIDTLVFPTMYICIYFCVYINCHSS